MASTRLGLTDTEMTCLADACGRDVDDLAAELDRRPWAIHDLLAEPRTIDTVLGGDALDETPAPFVFFAVITRLAADELLGASYVNDWIGPRSRLPVFDVEPVQEFAGAPDRVLFVARLLASMVDPGAATPVPEVGCDPWDLVDWLEAVREGERAPVLRRIGDLALYVAGVHADAIGHGVLSAEKAERVGTMLGMSEDEILGLHDPASASPGLDALEQVGARSYREARRGADRTPPIVADVAERIRAARRFLTHVSDVHLSPIEPDWPLVG